jgi:hypothetical protein
MTQIADVDSIPTRGATPKERGGILAKLKTKGKLTTKELATYGIAEKRPEEPKAKEKQEETRDSGAVVSAPTRWFPDS